MASLFQSAAEFQLYFNRGLQDLLAADAGLESSILVLANALFDAALLSDLQPALQRRFSDLAGSEVPAHYRPLFALIEQQGLGALATVHRSQGGWALQFNPLRNFRPARAAAVKIEALQAPFAVDGFHFNKAFLAKEILWEGALLGRSLRLLYNKFPFVPLHGLWVLDAELQRPQFLGEADHAYVWDLLQQCHIPSLGLAYNSYGAYASVNHLHFQSFIGADLPILDRRWQHNGGSQAYPLPCLRFEDMASAWGAIAALHEQGQAYNLLYLPGLLYLCPRLRQGVVPLPVWSHGLAWYELSGGFSCNSLAALSSLSADELASSLAAIAL